MTPFYLTKIYENSLEEREQDQSHHSPFTIATASSSCPFPFLFTTPQDQASHTDHQLQLEPIDLLMFGGPTDPLVKDEDPQVTGKWMSSKMRIMRKMMSSDQARASKEGTTIQVLENQRQQGQDSSSSSSANSSIIRVCSDCNTTKTPLWRSGPRGPKSLCNACGIRQRKARRAMAAVAASGGLVVPSGTTTKMQKKREEVDHTIPFKKRYRIANTGTNKKKIRLDDVTISLGKNSACHRVFPQDERDAAILLMALSCGLIRS